MSVVSQIFSQAGHLQRHTRTHIGEKPYVCSQCQKSFSLSGHLKTHLKSHTGEKNYGCLQCDKAFSTAAELKLHTRSHTGEKPYVCSLHFTSLHFITTTYDLPISEVKIYKTRQYYDYVADMEGPPHSLQVLWEKVPVSGK